MNKYFGLPEGSRAVYLRSFETFIDFGGNKNFPKNEKKVERNLEAEALLYPRRFCKVTDLITWGGLIICSRGPKMSARHLMSLFTNQTQLDRVGSSVGEVNDKRQLASWYNPA